MALAKIKKDDQVIVLSGKYKGKTGVVLKIISEKNKVLVRLLKLNIVVNKFHFIRKIYKKIEIFNFFILFT